MRFNTLVCLDFKGDELSANEWRQIDHLSKQRQVVRSSELASLADPQAIEALLVKLGAKAGPELIDQFPNLKYIGMLGTGYGGIDTTYAQKKGITVTNIADYATEGVAEFTFGLLLEQLRSISQAKQQAAKGDYSDNFAGSEIKGKKFAVIGMGNIGRRTAQLAEAFGAEVIYWSKHRKPEVETQGVKYRPLDKLLAEADIITLNLALNRQTEGIINANRLKLLKKGAIFINPSPMELINFPGLVKRLNKADITFMLDHSDEMTAAQLKALHKLANCLIYPPIAYLTTEASQLKKRIYIDNLKNYLANKPTNKVNK